MMTEIVIIGAVCGAVVVADQQNLFQNNVEKKWLWDPSRWTPAPAARFQTQNRFFAPVTAEQRVQQGQQALANATRMIDQAARQQLTETKVSNGLGKYVLTGGN